MQRDITATPEQLYGDGRYAADVALDAAIDAIDRQFGQGHAKANPALVGAYLQAAVTAGAMANQSRILEGIAASLCAAIEDLANTMRRID